MIREINRRYRDLRNDVREFEPFVADFLEKSALLMETLKKPTSLEQVLEMAKVAEALPSEIREIKLRATKVPSSINSDQFRYCVRLRSNNGYVDLSVINKGRAILKTYYELAEMMIAYTIKRLQANPTETNNHKAICLYRDLARFKAYLGSPSYEDRKDIHWEELEPEGDYLSNGYSLELMKERIIDVARREDTKGLYLWSLKWDCHRMLNMIRAMEALVGRIVIFGEARLELTPEQLDAIDPQ